MQGRNRKVYMLYGLEPSVKVKGNAFYTAVMDHNHNYKMASLPSLPPRKQEYHITGFLSGWSV